MGTEEPTTLPPTTDEPSFTPSHPPTVVPTPSPTVTPTDPPTREPTATPTEDPTEVPTETPTYIISHAPDTTSTVSPAGSGCDYALTYLQTQYSVYFDAVTAAETTLTAATWAKDQAKIALDAAQSAFNPMRETCRTYESITYSPTSSPTESGSAAIAEANIDGAERVSVTQDFKADFQQESKDPLTNILTQGTDLDHALDD